MILLLLLAVALALSLGFLLAWLARDELVAGRAWFRRLTLIGIATGGWFSLTHEEAASLACFAIALCAFISYVKSFDKHWTKK